MPTGDEQVERIAATIGDVHALPYEAVLDAIDSAIGRD